MRFSATALVCAAFLGFGSAAYADTVTTYNFGGTLTSGDTVTGTLTLDLSAADVFTALAENITIVDVTGTYLFDSTPVTAETVGTNPSGAIKEGILTITSLDGAGDTLTLNFLDDEQGDLTLSACAFATNSCRLSQMSPFMSIVGLGSSNYHLASGALAPSTPAGVNGAPSIGVTPEPSSLVLLGTGLAGAADMIRRRLSNA